MSLAVGSRSREDAVELVRHLSRVDLSDDQRRVAASLARAADPDAIFETATDLGVSPVVMGHLSNGVDCPAEVRERAVGRARSTATRNLHLATELHRVLDAFEDAGVRALPYKGPVLAVQAYGDVSWRDFGDLDFFVDPDAAEDAADALRSMGYELVTETRFSPRDVARGGHVIRTPAEFVFAHDDGPVVELRWRIGGDFRPIELPFDDCWERREEVTVLGRSVPTFGAEDALLVLARHGTKHHWNRLSWVVDVAAFVERVSVDWDVLVARAARLRLRRVLDACLLLASVVADASVPDWVLASARADSRVTSVVADAATYLDEHPDTAAYGIDEQRRHDFDLRLCDTRGDQLRILARLAFAPQEVDAATLELPRSLHGLYYAVRPLRLLAQGASAAIGRATR